MIIIVPLESPSLSDTLPGELELTDDVGDVLVELVGDVVLVELNLTSEVADLIVGEFGLVIPVEGGFLLDTDGVSGFM
jgi:hypothetical protein